MASLRSSAFLGSYYATTTVLAHGRIPCIAVARTERRPFSVLVHRVAFNSVLQHHPNFGSGVNFPRDAHVTTATIASSTMHKYLSTERYDDNQDESKEKRIRLSKLISQYSRNLALSRREAERRISQGRVTVAGKAITTPHFLLSWGEAYNNIKVDGKLVVMSKTRQDQSPQQQHETTRVWLVHKLAGEVVAENDPKGRPSMLERLVRGGVGKVVRGGKKNKERQHLKPIGRLDMSTQGLILVTNNGSYAREMELPSNQVHRVYRARVHGRVTPYKLKAIQSGVTVGNVHYGPMKVSVEASPRNNNRSPTNSWLCIECTEGKNRQVRNVLGQLGLTVTRLIRVSYGDYQLQTIPPGMALEVPVKPLARQKRQGALFPLKKRKEEKPKETLKNPVQWVTHFSSLNR